MIAWDVIEQSKRKLSRREGQDLFGTGGPSLERRLSQPPGMHGNKPTRETSVYAEQLSEKQKVKRIYGLREDQFRRFMGKLWVRPCKSGNRLD